MSWEFDENQAEPVKDRTPYIWFAIIAGFGLMIAGLWFMSREPATYTSRAYVKHIYIPYDRAQPGDRDRAMELITDLRARIVSKEASFEEIARDYSAEDATRAKGGHYGWLGREDIAEGVAYDFIWDGPVEELSPILESQVGFHLFYVEERRLSDADRFEREIEQRVLGDDEPEAEPEGAQDSAPDAQ